MPKGTSNGSNANGSVTAHFNEQVFQAQALSHVAGRLL